MMSKELQKRLRLRFAFGQRTCERKTFSERYYFLVIYGLYRRNLCLKPLLVEATWMKTSEKQGHAWRSSEEAERWQGWSCLTFERNRIKNCSYLLSKCAAPQYSVIGSLVRGCSKEVFSWLTVTVNYELRNNVFSLRRYLLICRPDEQSCHFPIQTAQSLRCSLLDRTANTT